MTPSPLLLVFTFQIHHREYKKPTHKGFPKSAPFVDWLPGQRGLLKKTQGIF